ncbi:hypothetical protein [uncultured Piscinibacter sp.]|uniref:hypothetical protein n=1 Tax=uncultured Piscinibacter sp. TaxID=1131835 RepID=UPI0026061141|nr:hypothetical protein [uncultured Piscinibacter sp.]
MSTEPREPWSFEDGPQVAERILRSYARWRLGTLPVLPYKPKQSDALIEGYRRLDDARIKTARQVCALSDPRLITTGSFLRREARVAWAVWDLVHRHLIAVELRRLKSEDKTADELKLVLLAERRVEALVTDLKIGQ